MAIWQASDDEGHAELIEHYLNRPGRFRSVQLIDQRLRRKGVDPLYAIVARKSGICLTTERD